MNGNGDISFSGAEIALIAGLLGAMATAVGALFHLVIRLYDGRIADKDAQIEFYKHLHAEDIDLAETATETLKRRTPPRRRGSS